MPGERSPQTDLSEESQLLADARRLFSRVLDWVTRTSSIKVWVPLLCSFVLTIYYIYTLHQKTVTSAALPQPVLEAPAKVVPDIPSVRPPVSFPAADSPPASTHVAAIDYAEARKDAEQAHSNRQFAEEARLWQEFMRKSPEPQQACPAIGKAYERIGDINASIRAYEKCAALEPDNPDILIPFAHALQGKSDFSRAAGLYHQCLVKNPKNMDARTGLALIALRQNRLSAAAEGANEVLHVAPDNTDALLIVGIVSWRQGDLQAAERIFSKGVGLDDKRPDFHAFLGRIAEAEQHPQEALRQYDKALAIDPNDSEITERRDRLQHP